MAELPKPYWQDREKGLDLHCGDCLLVLPLLPDCSVDMVFCDPPYGLEQNAPGGTMAARWEWVLGQATREECEGEERPIANDSREWFLETLPKVFAELARVLVRGGCCCCCGGGGGPQPLFAEMTLMLDRTPGLKFKQAVVWDKGGLGMGWHYRRSYEFVLVAEKSGAACKWYGGLTQSNVVRIPKIIPSAAQHPSEKPSELPEKFIRLHSQPGDLVLDCFMGRGSTGVAAKRTGRRFLGIELEERYCQDAAAKLGSIEHQLAGPGTLFDQGAPDA